MAIREHSRGELLEKLKKRGFESTDPLSIIRELEKEGLQSDKRFASEYVRSKVSSGYGPIRIMRDLEKKGVEKEVVFESVNALEIDWFNCAKKIYEKKFNSEVESVNDYARRVRFLIYKGFETEHVKAIVGEWGN